MIIEEKNSIIFRYSIWQTSYYTVNNFEEVFNLNQKNGSYYYNLFSPLKEKIKVIDIVFILILTGLNLLMQNKYFY
jgi:hypothetical protein